MSPRDGRSTVTVALVAPLVAAFCWMATAAGARAAGVDARALAAGAAGNAAWLFVSDVHLNPKDRSPIPVRIGLDTNTALLDSALAEMKRVDPSPPVVLIDGDFLAHRFNYANAISTMEFIARRFDRAFPRAQFLIAFGNEDAGAADYGFVPNSAFAKATAIAWAPLVNRNGTAPNFAETFGRDGFYTARLPVPHTQALVINDVFWSPFYRPGSVRGAGAQTIAELRAALQRTPNEDHWIVGHIPPGIDAHSTAHLLHGLLVVPFLDTVPRDQFLAAIADPANRVTLVIHGHTHKFSFRIPGTADRPVPMLLIPAISPIFRNAPAFLTADVDAGGTIRELKVHALLEGSWTEVGSTRSLGLDAFSGPELVSLQGRLENDADLRAAFDRLYQAGAPPEINERNWRTYWCAAAEFTDANFSACTGAGGVGLVTRRGILLIAIATIALLALAVFLWVRLRRRRPRVRTG
jgi:hypothetical protein